MIFKVALPVLFSVMVCEELLPTFTFPKATGEGLIDNCACVEVPDPVKLITSGEPGALLATDTVPVAAPATVGANVTVSVAVCPGVRVWAASVLMLKPVPLAVAPLIETLAVPLFVKVTLTVPAFPTVTLLKLMLAGLAPNPP